jgi:hypothetical protein
MGEALRQPWCEAKQAWVQDLFGEGSNDKFTAWSEKMRIFVISYCGGESYRNECNACLKAGDGVYNESSN